MEKKPNWVLCLETAAVANIETANPAMEVNNTIVLLKVSATNTIPKGDFQFPAFITRIPCSHTLANRLIETTNANKLPRMLTIFCAIALRETNMSTTGTRRWIATGNISRLSIINLRPQAYLGRPNRLNQAMHILFLTKRWQRIANRN